MKCLFHPLYKGYTSLSDRVPHMPDYICNNCYDIWLEAIKKTDKKYPGSFGKEYIDNTPTE